MHAVVDATEANHQRRRKQQPPEATVENEGDRDACEPVRRVRGWHAAVSTTTDQHMRVRDVIEGPWPQDGRLEMITDHAVGQGHAQREHQDKNAAARAAFDDKKQDHDRHHGYEKGVPVEERHHGIQPARSQRQVDEPEKGNVELLQPVHHAGGRARWHDPVELPAGKLKWSAQAALRSLHGVPAPSTLWVVGTVTAQRPVRTTFPISGQLALRAKAGKSSPAMQLVLNASTYDAVIRGLVPEARRFLWIFTADLKDLFAEHETGAFVPFLQMLAGKLREGVEIRLVHAKEPGPRFREDFDKFPEFIESDAFERILCPRMHMKVVIADGRKAYVGSANLTGAGMGAKSETRRNFEAGFVTEDEEHLRD